MTYRELKNRLDDLTDEDLDNFDVTILFSHEDEYYPIVDFRMTGPETNVLDEGHPILTT